MKVPHLYPNQFEQLEELLIDHETKLSTFLKHYVASTTEHQVGWDVIADIKSMCRFLGPSFKLIEQMVCAMNATTKDATTKDATKEDTIPF